MLSEVEDLIRWGSNNITLKEDLICKSHHPDDYC